MSSFDHERRKQLSQWAVQSLMPDAKSSQVESLSQEGSLMVPLNGDAGFRSYYRFQTPEGPLLAVDAPPETENPLGFVTVAGVLAAGGVRVPEIRAVDFERGFLLVEDFGDDVLLSKLSTQTAEGYYRQVFDVIHHIQRCDAQSLMPFSREVIERELNLCPQWFLEQLLGIELTADEQKMHRNLFELLVCSALQQPKAMMHRDFHSRNLLVLSGGELGVIDFQGALNGPVLYDVVSILKDCYIQWSAEKTERWFRYFVKQHSQLEKVRFETCLKWFDWIGLQRHLKCLGIFSRLGFRDKKLKYLKELPATFAYVADVCCRYDELAFYGEWLKVKVEPFLDKRINKLQDAKEVVTHQ